VPRSGHTLPEVARGRAGSLALTAISRVMVVHSAEACSRVSVARQVPAAGAATSASQKYGGPPRRSRDLVATLPSGAISDSSPSSGFSAAKTTRSGAPFQGVNGDGRTVSPAASAQAEPCACATRGRRSAPAISRAAVTRAIAWRAGINRAPMHLSGFERQ
jgi:hypothetical protein